MRKCLLPDQLQSLYQYNFLLQTPDDDAVCDGVAHEQFLQRWGREELYQKQGFGAVGALLGNLPADRQLISLWTQQLVI